MSLSERLELARRQREAEASGATFDADEWEAPAKSASVEADPGADCPKCGVTGRIDVVDLYAQEAHMTCIECGTAWMTAQVGAVTRRK